MLASIAVFAVIGGAFASKQRILFNSVVYTAVGGAESSGSNACTVKEVNNTRTTRKVPRKSPAGAREKSLT
jgi:hypothetical protein